MKNEIYLHKISKSFGQERVLRSCTLRFEEGNIYGIIGRNGSGKTVLLKIICGLYQPDSGYIEINGKKMDSHRAFLENVGALIETPGFLNGYSGYQNLKFLADIRKTITKDKIQEAMEQVGLDWKLKKKVGKYSLGMRQRLGIAQAIMEDPQYLLLDEPMNGLDVSGVEWIRNLLIKKKEEKKIVLIASHVQDDIKYLCDEVYEITDGEISVKKSKN